jgi:hypothetical protein
MMGFADATELRGRPLARRSSGSIEASFNPGEPVFGRHTAQKEEQVILPFYTGNVTDITESDLDNTGTLIQVYSPKLFLPQVRLITVHNITSRFGLPSGLFNVYGFDDAERVLRPDDRILLPGKKRVEQILPVFETINEKRASHIVKTFADTLRTYPEAPRGEGERIYHAIRTEQRLLTEYVRLEFGTLHNELADLKRQLTSGQRALAETPERVAKAVDWKKIVTGSPQRIAEDAFDDLVKGAAVGFARMAATMFLN